MENEQPRILNKNIDWLSVTLSHPLQKFKIKLFIRTAHFFIRALSFFENNDFWDMHKSKAGGEVFQIEKDLSSGACFNINNYEYQRGLDARDTVNGIRLYKDKSMTKMDFQGLFFLCHQEKAISLTSIFLRNLCNLFSRKKNKYNKIQPRITRIDGKMDIATTQDITSLLPDFTSSEILAGFKYEKVEYGHNKNGIEIKNAITIKSIGEGWMVIIYDKPEEVSKWTCQRKKALFDKYLEKIGLKKNERLYRVELRYSGWEKCKFIQPYVLKENICPEEITNLVFKQFYKKHRVRIKDKERKNPNRYPDCPRWNFLFNQEVAVEELKPVSYFSFSKTTEEKNRTRKEKGKKLAKEYIRLNGANLSGFMNEQLTAFKEAEIELEKEKRESRTVLDVPRALAKSDKLLAEKPSEGVCIPLDTIQKKGILKGWIKKISSKIISPSIRYRRKVFSRDGLKKYRVKLCFSSRTALLKNVF